MRWLIALAVVAACRGDGDARGGAAAPVVLRARPAAVVELTLKALGIT